MSFLEVVGLEAGYGGVQVLWGASLAMERAGIACLVGSNGAGKTTLLRTLSGLVAARAGSARFLGETIIGLRPDQILARGIAHVPEGRRLFASMSVQDNLLMGAYRHRGRAILGLERAYSLFPRLKERRRQDAATLSGGEQQMCAIARGLMSEPKLLLIDELSLGLAPMVVDELAVALAGVAETGTGILLVEQDVAVALDLASEGFVLDRGRIVLSGGSAALGADPRVREAYHDIRKQQVNPVGGSARAGGVSGGVITLGCCQPRGYAGVRGSSGRMKRWPTSPPLWPAVSPASRSVGRTGLCSGSKRRRARVSRASNGATSAPAGQPIPMICAAACQRPRSPCRSRLCRSET
jgi:branched-chain amino acid transport system ATP-binding protein